jgi:hypothetical protein
MHAGRRLAYGCWNPRGRRTITTIIGIDAATDPKKIGLALGSLQGTRISIADARLGVSEAGLISTVAGWVRSANQVLLAIDAPLGWPVELSSALIRHEAGQGLSDTANMMFRRAIDRFIRLKIGKQSLDVGADRIARTAFAALGLLESVRKSTALPIPLAWDPLFDAVAAIEVYPSATLRAHGLSTAEYKAPTGRARRAEIVQAVSTHLNFQLSGEECIGNADVLDATLCLLAGADFLLGHAFKPSDPARARREGWIWVRDPARTCNCRSPRVSS